MAESIEKLKIYKSAQALQDEVFKLVRQFPADKINSLGADLRRSSAAVSHHIAGAHRLFSYRLKLDELSAMRREAAVAQKQLESAHNFVGTAQLRAEYTTIIKQSLGISNCLNIKIEQTQRKRSVSTDSKMFTVSTQS